MACVNLAALPGHEYMFRERAEGSNAITEIFGTVHKKFMDLSEEQLADVDYARHNLPFAGEMYMGHLRYSTTGKSGLTFVHPFLRRNNWRAKNLCLCGNFNMTNVHVIFEKLLAMGQSPRIYSDTYITLELMGHRLDREVERNFIDAQKKGLKGRDITDYIDDNVKMANVLKTTMTDFDGGYVMCGLTGSGEMFAMRDPWGIRPAFWYKDDEVIAVASERPVLQTTFGLDCDDIHELEPGQAIVVTKNGVDSLEQIIEQRGVLLEELGNMPGVTVFDSDSNYVLFRVADAGQVWQGLYDRGVLIRDFSHSQYLENCLRVSVGSPEENQVFLGALTEILNERS